MNKESLVKRLGKKVLFCFLSGFLVFIVFSNYGCVDEFVDPNSENPKKPVAMLTANPTEGDAPLEVSFDGSLSYARIPKSYLEKYLWDFDGDGDTDLTTLEAYIDHIYEEAGNYNPTLVVEDSQGLISNKTSLEIIVNEDIVSLGRIAFWSNRPVSGEDYNDDIYSGDIVVRVRDNNIELRNIERLTTDPGQDAEPVWSPDGNQIVFVSYREGDTALYIMDADGTDQRRLTDDIGYAAWPDWCSDEKIVFTYYDRDSELTGIATINPDGTGFTKLTEQPALGSTVRPPTGSRCSPDASKIAFSAYSEWQYDIYIMNADGTNPANLTNHPSGDFSPSWSPDGNQIAFSSSREVCGSDIFIVNIDGSNVVNLTNTSNTLEGTPAWSPDGEWIAYMGGSYVICDEEGNLIEQGGTSGISIMKTDGSNALRLDEYYYSANPAWRPKIEE